MKPPLIVNKAKGKFEYTIRPANAIHVEIFRSYGQIARNIWSITPYSFSMHK